MIRRSALLLLAAVLVALPSFAGKNCTWQSWPTVVDLNSYSVFGGRVATSAQFTINCNPNLVATVTTSTGQAPTYSPRRMNSGTNILPYNLYIDANDGFIWTNSGINNIYTLDSSTTKTFTRTFYASIQAGWDVAPGTYADTISATVNDNIAGDADTISFTVRVVVPAECRVSSFTMNFPDYDPVSANASTAATASAPINVLCTATTKASVTLGPGLNPSAISRRMVGPGGLLLDYDIYTTSAYATIWNTTNVKSATSTGKSVPIGNDQPTGGFLAWGSIPPNQNVPAGKYTDTVVATVTVTP